MHRSRVRFTVRGLLIGVAATGFFVWAALSIYRLPPLQRQGVFSFLYFLFGATVFCLALLQALGLVRQATPVRTFGRGTSVDLPPDQPSPGEREV